MANVADLDEDTIMAARECFNLYARGESTLSGENLYTALRSVSVNPTMKEILEKGDGNEEMDMEAFITTIADTLHEGYPSSAGKGEVLAAFEAYDVGKTGKIDAGDLTYILTNSGEELPAAEVKMALKQAGSGSIDYKAFVDQIFKGVPTTASSPKKSGGSKPAKKKPAADDGFGDGFGDDNDGFGDDDDGDDFGF